MRVDTSGPASPLAPGDAVRVSNWREPQMTGDYQIDESGHAVFPLIGRIEVSGRDPGTVRAEILAEYAKELRNPDLEITPLRRVAILGGVQSPGLYLIDPTMRLADAVALAEGASQTGDIKETLVMRDGYDITESVTLDAPLLSQLESGDQIFVPEKSWLERNGIVLLASTISAIAIIVGATLR
jgi:polysaccharide export outer membrane protein